MAGARQNHVSGRQSRRPRRPEDFEVRRWLQLGAASAGMGAALLGFSLLGPQTGVAAADSTGDSSVSSASPESDAGPAAPAAESVGADTDADAEPDDDADVGDDEGHDEEEPDSDDDSGSGDSDSDEPAGDDSDSDGSDRDDSDSYDEDAAAEDVDDAETSQPAETGDARPLQVAEATAVQPPPTVATVEPVPAPPSLTPRRSWDQIVAKIMTDWAADNQAWIDSLDVDEERKAELQASFLAMRRTFFNQAPTVAPIQISGRLSGPITGTIGAVDAEGDRIVYRLSSGPREGSVVLNADGSYTYTPDSDFDGVDTFRVIAIDVGLHVNLLDPFRGLGTRVKPLINQRAITFEFTFTDDGTGWTPDRQQALRRVADELVSYFLVNAPVMLTYDVGLEDPDSLASAYSDPTSEFPGYWRTVVQHKLIDGVDSNGAEADGEISWNWDEPWALGESVGSGEFDFTSVAIHELLHSFGFLTTIVAAGENSGGRRNVYDRYIITADGRRPFDGFARWRTRYDQNLTGGDGGLYFGGANAVAAYGGLVPLYTPAVWNPGSSMHHVDDDTFTGPDSTIMNAFTRPGLGVRVLSEMELGILADLGYHVVPRTPASAV